MADEKYSALANGGGLAAADEFAVARAGVSVRVTPIGVPVLVFRYTVAGADKSGIDTGVDTPDAGSNDWSGGDLLEVLLYARTDEASVLSSLAITLNNDNAGNYDFVWVGTSDTTALSGNNRAQTSWNVQLLGASAGANFFGVLEARMPNYTGTVGYKPANLLTARPDGSAAANMSMLNFGGTYRNTAAVTRLAVAPLTAGKKLKVGSQLLIYKRLAS